MKNIKYIVAAMLAAAVAYAAVDLNVSKVNDPRPQQFVAGTYTGPIATTTNKVTKSLGNSATINFSSSAAGVALSSSITVPGAKAGDPCFAGVPTAAAALKAVFGCYVDATDSAKVFFSPQDMARGDFFLDGGAQTVTVSSGSLCMCNDRDDATKGCKMPVSSTTATITGTGGDIVNYSCAAPVDPASGTFYVRILSNQ